MRNANEIQEEPQSPEIRMTVQTPRELADEFRAAAKRRDQTLSQEIRRLMREYVAEQAA